MNAQPKPAGPQQSTEIRLDCDRGIAAYERLKREFIAACPGASQQQYEAAMAAIARATGV